MKVANLKVLPFLFFILPFAFLAFGGCVAYQVAGEVERGRPQLIFGDPKIALENFQRAAELQPDFRYNFTLLNGRVVVRRARALSRREPGRGKESSRDGSLPLQR